MTEPDNLQIWTIIVATAIGSYALRFLFLGFVGDRPMPEWMLRHLRYSAVAILPALVAPLVVWPDATGGELDPPRLTAAVVTLVVGLWFKNVLAALLSGAGTLYLMLSLFS